MKWTSEAILELIELERRRSSTRRTLSVAGLVVGGGLLGAAILMFFQRGRDPTRPSKAPGQPVESPVTTPLTPGPADDFHEGAAHA